MSITTSTIPARRDIDGMAVIGRTKHALMGIRHGEGEGGADAAADAAAAGADDKAPWTKENFDPERAQKLVENLRGDIAAQKAKTDAAIAEAVEKSQKDFAATLAKALGGGEQAETDPVKLAAQVTDLSSKIEAKDGDLTKAQAGIKARDLQLAVAILSPELGGNTKLLLTNEQFKTSIASVEPTDEAAIKAAITKALQDNAALKQPPARSGAGDHTGPTVQSLEAQLKAADEKKDISETIRLKRAIASARTAQAQ